MSVHPSKRAEFKAVMKDRWENIGQEEGLSPYVEPGHDTEDPPAASGNDREEGKMSRQSPTSLEPSPLLEPHSSLLQLQHILKAEPFDFCRNQHHENH